MSDSDQAQVARFGVFELDTAAGELRRLGRLVSLPRQPLRVLTLLVRRAGEIVTREELSREIWGDTNVDFEAGLATCINQIRTALGDRAASPRFIETVPKRGYRFLAPVAPVHPTVDAAPTGIGPAPVTPSGAPAFGWAALFAAVVLVLTISLLTVPVRTRVPGAAPIRIVVVPVGADTMRPDLDAVSRSLTDALIGTLVSEAGAGAKVASPLAVEHLRGRERTLDDLRALDAEYFVDVALRWLGGPVLVHAKLAHISGWILWASDEEMPMEHLQRQQLSIARTLAKRVAAEIVPSSAGRRAPKADAVADYAQGMADLANGRIAPSLAAFERALAADAHHPGTLAGLAQATIAGVATGLVDRRTGFETAARHARRAIALDPTNARARAALTMLDPRLKAPSN